VGRELVNSEKALPVAKMPAEAAFVEMQIGGYVRAPNASKLEFNKFHWRATLVPQFSPAKLAGVSDRRGERSERHTANASLVSLHVGIALPRLSAQKDENHEMGATAPMYCLYALRLQAAS
jgi:hypothetical protein